MQLVTSTPDLMPTPHASNNTCYNATQWAARKQVQHHRQPYQISKNATCKTLLKTGAALKAQLYAGQLC
jgi:hypothetical protein